MSDRTWDDARDVRLRSLWNSGHSATQIAKLMATASWKPSRSAIIGRVHRLGLGRGDRANAASQSLANVGRKLAAVGRRPGANLQNAVNSAVQNALARTKAKPGPKPKADAGPPVETDSGPLRAELLTPTIIGLVNLTDHACKWPIGEGPSDTLGFCGRKRAKVGPYCKAHQRIAWTGVPAPKRTQREARYG